MYINIYTYDRVKLHVCVVCCGGDEFSKRLQAEVKWVSSIDIHPGGEGVCVCGGGERVCGCG